MHVQTPLDKRRAAGVDLPDRKEREDESSGAGVPEGRSGAGAGGGRSSAAGTGGGAGRLSASYYEDKELEEIFKRTYGEPKRSYPPGNALGQRTAEARSTGGLGPVSYTHLCVVNRHTKQLPARRLCLIARLSVQPNQ